jgi:NAD(P)-dependent dehydrogenase (short-subunit alcohol dehydrogenase family)
VNNVIITGASRGIGKAIALTLARDFPKIYLVSRSKDALEDVSEEIRAAHPFTRVEVCPISVTDEAAVKGLMHDVREADGDLQSLINCAGYAIPATAVEEISSETWMEVYEANMLSTFLMTRESLPLLKRNNRASIVNIASTAGLTPRPGWSAYASAKAALVNFSQTMGEELKPYGIRVHCVAPGRTATELRAILAPDEDPSTIMGPGEVAKVVQFLVSPHGDVLKGQPIMVRGD